MSTQQPTPEQPTDAETTVEQTTLVTTEPEASDSPSQRGPAPVFAPQPMEPVNAPNMTREIAFTLNGRPVRRSIDVRSSLLEVLREIFGLTSVKKGCEVGECGACAVLLDGLAVDSCIYLAVWADGHDLVTTEGLASPEGDLSVVQQAFVDETAVQCGFCTPGFIMSATEIVNSGQDYTRDELRSELAGHLCRCTGYENILNAVESSITKSREHTDQKFWDAVKDI